MLHEPEQEQDLDREALGCAITNQNHHEQEVLQAPARINNGNISQHTEIRNYVINFLRIAN